MISKCYEYRFNKTLDPACDSFEQCAKLVSCPPADEPDVTPTCFALAKIETNTTTQETKAVLLATGCYPRACNQDKCLGYYREQADVYYCCCREEGCNNKLVPQSTSLTTTTPTVSLDFEQSFPLQTTNSQPESKLPVISIIVIFTIFLVASFIFYRKRSRRFSANPTDHSMDVLKTSENSDFKLNLNLLFNNQQQIDLNSIQLLELLGIGRFGNVHKARLMKSGDIVAVKSISYSQFESWLNEVNIYKSLKTKSPNILNFLGVCDNPRTGCNWLIVEYASKGSLHDYLKTNLISWDHFLSISLSLTQGLAFLHEANIVHRDFKSKNVLLKNDLTPCITDFGLAELLDSTDWSSKKKFLQVGTPRYMAPEVLECAVVFEKGSFAKIDAYALALVLWELLSRCHPLPIDRQSDVHQPYKMPFEDAVGPNPDIYAMRKAVLKDKIRPQLKTEWNDFPVSKVRQTIIDGWEYDHDARISASCYLERMKALIRREDSLEQSA